MADAHRAEIAKLESLYAENPGGRVFTHLAEAYRKAGELERARSVLEEGIGRHPDYSSAHVVLGRVLMDQGENPRAAAEFHRVLELDSHNLVALRSLGDLARAEGRTDDALGYYHRLLDVEPTDEDVRAVVADLDSPAATPAGFEDDGHLHDAPDVWTPVDDDREPAEPVDGEAGWGQEPAGETAEPLQPAGEPGPTAGAAEHNEDAGPVSEYDPGVDLGRDAVQEPEMAAAAEPEADREPEREPEPEPEPEAGTEPARLYVSDITEPPPPTDAPEETGPERIDAAGPEPPIEAAGPEVQAEPEPGPAPSGEEPTPMGEHGGYDWTVGEEPAWTHEAEPEPETAAAQEAGADLDPEPGSDVATETIANIYARQGLYDRAADVYRQLLRTRPDDEALRAKLEEMEGLAAGAIAEDAEPWTGGSEAIEGFEAAEFQPGDVDAAPLEGLESGELEPSAEREEGSPWPWADGEEDPGAGAGAGEEPWALSDDTDASTEPEPSIEFEPSMDFEPAEPEPESVEAMWTGAGGAASQDESPYAWTETEATADDSAPIGSYFGSLLSWMGSARGSAPADAGSTPEPEPASTPEPSEPEGPTGAEPAGAPAEDAPSHAWPAEPSPEPGPEPGPGPELPEPADDDDLDTFRSWLESLKQ